MHTVEVCTRLLRSLYQRDMLFDYLPQLHFSSKTPLCNLSLNATSVLITLLPKFTAPYLSTWRSQLSASIPPSLNWAHYVPEHLVATVLSLLRTGPVTVSDGTTRIRGPSSVFDCRRSNVK